MYQLKREKTMSKNQGENNAKNTFVRLFYPYASVVRGLKVICCSFFGVFWHLFLRVFSGFSYWAKGLWRGVKYYCYEIFYRIIKLCVRPFLRAKIVGKKNIAADDSARVFVANHLEVYGPVLAYLHLPVRKKRFWIIDKMMDANLAAQQMSYAVNDPNNFKWAPKWLKKLGVKALKGIASYVLVCKAKGISVSRDNARKMIQTFQESVSAMGKGYSVVLFPEMQYKERGFGEVYDGFVTLGKYYYKKTGKLLSFYPVYIDKFDRKMNIGKPIKFDPEKPNDTARIVNYLSSEINAFANTN